ncbi:hypothetical protein JYK21_09535 [Ralstonia pickettii]|nr:hypothetical protein [Ralstonia pickettii]
MRLSLWTSQSASLLYRSEEARSLGLRTARPTKKSAMALALELDMADAGSKQRHANFYTFLSYKKTKKLKVQK